MVPPDLQITNESVLNSLMQPPPNYGTNNNYRLDDDENIPEITRYIYDDMINEDEDEENTQEFDDDDGDDEEENNDHNMMDQEIYDAELIPGEEFAPENYNEEQKAVCTCSACVAYQFSSWPFTILSPSCSSQPVCDCRN